LKEDATYSTLAEGRLQDLTGKALKLVVVNYGSRLLGLVRTMVLAAVFGASMQIDVFYGIFGAVLVFFEIIPQAFSQAFVPVYTRFVSEKRWRELGDVSVSYCFTGAFILLAIFMVLSYFAEPIVMKIYVFSEPGKEMVQVGVLLFRYSLLVMLINYFVGNFSAILYAKDIVVAPSAVNLLRNIIIIGAIIAWQKPLGVTSIALGFTLGGVVQMFYLALMAISSGWRLSWPRVFPYATIGYMWRLFLPAFFGLAVAQINIIVDRYFASSLQREGDVAVLSYANILIGMITVFTISLTTAIFPKFSHQVSHSEIDEMKDMLNKALRALFFFVFPVMALVYLASSPLVYAVFKVGELSKNPESIDLLLSLFRIFCIWVIFYSVNYQLLLVFFSFRDTVTPSLVSAFNVGCNIFFNWLFTRVYHFGVQGIVFSTTLSVVITTGLLIILLYPRIGHVFDMRILKGFVRTCAACAALVLVVIVFNLISRAGVIYRTEGHTAADIAYLLAVMFFGLTAYSWASLGVNRDLTLYFFKNWRFFLGLSKW
jgi:putative peptidoglycan lipid II flippase